MNYFKENFGTEKVNLTNEEQALLNQQLKKVDEKRLEFIALVSLIVVFILFIFDFFYFNQSLRQIYLIVDSIFLIITSFLLIISFSSKRRDHLIINYLKRVIFNSYLLFLILWSCGVCSLDPSSMLNFITFYFVLYLIVFIVVTPFKTLLFYYFLITIEYLSICYFFEKPFFTETFYIIELGCLLLLPFYFSFRSSRISSQSAMIKLSSINQYLQNEVEMSIRELQLLNNNLNIEVGQRKVIESKLRESLKLVESSNQLKSEFLANISHEIRTPLNSIVGFTEMMTEDGVTTERKKEYQALIASNTMYLLSTIDDIFDASMLKTDQIKPVMKPFRVDSFLDNIFYEVNGIELKYDKKHIQLKTKNIENLTLKINTDEFYLKKSIMRLIDNAFKFTEQGSIEIGVNVSNGYLEFFVSDTGIGIAEKDQIRIFEPFVQGDGSFTRGHGGSGLGLTIVKGISKALGADFTFHSNPGVGSTFTIRFNKYFL
jgi:signal transduction histidine kinase